MGAIKALPHKMLIPWCKVAHFMFYKGKGKIVPVRD
jgi:hypothetical protein